MSTRDYTDSEDDSDSRSQGGFANDNVSLAPSSPSVPKPSSSPTKPGPSNHALRITLRPNLTHLGDRDDDQPSSPTSQSERSPSPLQPHPIRLKLGMKHSLGSNAAYSSSEDEGDKPEPRNRSPPAKKQRTKSAKPRASGGGNALPAPHRKTYDWLQPSSASASHHGPEGRQLSVPQHTSVDDDLAALSDGNVSTTGSVPASESKPKKAASRRKGDAAPGPGKNWRKGMKKGDPIPWKDGATFLGGDHKVAKSSPLATPQRPSLSTEGSPEPLDTTAVDAALQPAREREASPPQPFVLADAQKLGFVVFSKPIVAPKITLGPFPKVTQSFAPMDKLPFRKEPVRQWTTGEKTMVGVGGGTLKFKTWQRGPESELGKIIREQKEAESAARAKKKADAAAAAGDSTPGPHDRVSDSVPPTTEGTEVPGTPQPDGDAMSEIGDGEDSASVVGVSTPRDSPAPPAHHVAASPSPASRRGKGKGKGSRPRKSKLAQEIIIPAEPSDESGAPSVEPEGIKSES